jgi:hypothetical protein
MLKKMFKILRPDRPGINVIHFDADNHRYEATDGKIGLFLEHAGSEDYYLDLDGKEVEKPDGFVSVGKMVPENSFEVANVSANDLIKLLKALVPSKMHDIVSIYVSEEKHAPLVVKQRGHSENFGIIATMGGAITVPTMLANLAKKYTAYAIDYDGELFHVSIIGAGHSSGKTLSAAVTDLYITHGGGCD